MRHLIWSRFLRRCFLSRRPAGTRTSSKRLPRASVSPRLEALEDRTLLSNIYTVNQLGDAGTGSGLSGDIRYCINQANLNPGSTIQFSTTGTILLSNGELPIKVDMTIQGPGTGPKSLQIWGNGGGGASRVFDITSSAATVTISNLTIANGNAEVANTPVPGNQGGDIFNGGNLTLINDVVTNGFANGTVGGPIGRGGAIFNAEGNTGVSGATLILDNTIVENSKVVGIFTATTGAGAGEGGGVYNDTNATLIVENGSQIKNNQAVGATGQSGTAPGQNGYNGGAAAGGGIYNNNGTLEINGSNSAAVIISDNVSLAGSGGKGIAGSAGQNGNVGGTGGTGGSGGRGGDALGGGVFNTGTFSLQYVDFLGNQAQAGGGALGASGGAGGSGTTATGGLGGAGGVGGSGGNAQGGGIYSGVGTLTAPHVVFGVDSNGVGNEALAGGSAAAGAGGTGGKGKTVNGIGGVGGVGGAGGFAKGGAVANYGGNVSFTSATFTSSLAVASSGSVGGSGGPGLNAANNGAPGGAGGAGFTGGRGGDAVGGAVFNAKGDLSILNSVFTANQAFAGLGGMGGGGGVGGVGGGGSSKVNGGVGGTGGAGGAGGAGGNAQGGGFYNLVGTVTVKGTQFTANGAGTGNQVFSGSGGAGGVAGTGGQGGDDSSSSTVAGDGGAGGVGGAGGNAGLAEGGAGGNQGGGTTLTSAVFTSSKVLTGIGGTGGNGGIGGKGGNGGSFPANGYGGAGGNGGAGGTSGPAFGGALAVTASDLTILNSTFGALGKGNQVIGGNGGGGGVGGTIGTFGHSNPYYKLKHDTGNGGQGGQGASVSGGALSANGSTQTITITGSTFEFNALTSGNGGAGGAGGVFSSDGKFQGLNGQGGAGGLAQGGGLLLAATSSQSATLTGDTISNNKATGGIGGAGTINNDANGYGGITVVTVSSAKYTVAEIGKIPPLTPGGLNGFGSNGGNGGSIQGAGLADVNYNLSIGSSSFDTNAGKAGAAGAGGGAIDTEPYTFHGGTGGAGGNVLGGGVFVSNNSSGSLALSFNGGSASNNTLTAGKGGVGGNAGASGQSNITGGFGGAGGYVQGGGIYVLAGSKGINTTALADLTLAGNVLTAGSGGAGGAGYNAVGGTGGNAQGGAVFNSSLNNSLGQNSSLSLTSSTVSGNQATSGVGGNAGSATTPNGGAGGAGGNAGNAEGAGLYNGDNTPVTVVNSTFGGSTNPTSSANYNILTGGRGGSGGDAGTPTGVLKTNGGPGGVGGSVLGGNIYNVSNADFINDTIVFGQAVAYGLGGPGGSGAGLGGLPGAAGDDGTGIAGGYYAVGGTNSVGNTIIDLNAAVPLPPPAVPRLVASSSGGSWTAQTAWVLLTYVNNNGETVGSALSSIAVPANGTLTIDSPAPEGSGSVAATGWYAYVGVGSQPPASTAMYRQQAAGSPTPIGTNLILTANPTTTGANPPTSNTAAVSLDAFGSFTSLGHNILGDTTGDTGFGSTTADQTGITAAQLNLGPLQNNAGPTLTDALNSPSVAIDTGGNTLVTSTSNPWYNLFGPTPYDQRGYGWLRIYNGTVDVGAFEYQPTHQMPVITNLSPNSAVEQGNSFLLTISGSNFITGALVNWAFAGNLASYGTDILTPASISSNQITVTVPAKDLPDEGTVNVTVSVPDGSGVKGEVLLSLPVTFTINEGTAVTLSNPGSLTNNESDTITPVTITSSDPDTTFNDLVNGQDTLPPGLTIDPNTGVISGTIGAYAAGTYQVTVNGLENGVVQGSTTFTWTVSDTTAPSFTIANQTNNEGDTVTVNTNPVDADAGSITATGLPPGLSIDSTTGVITGTIGAYAAGTYTVTVSATDGTLKGSTQFTWTVNDTNPPSFTIANQTNNEGDTVSVKTNPLDAAPGTITATGLPSGLSIDSTTGLITGTIGAYAAGTYTVILNATDVAGNKGSAQFTWTVNDTTPPSFTIANQNNNEGDTVSVKTSPVDADAGSITATNLPTGLSINANTGVISGTIGTYVAGTYTVTVSATDGTVKGSTTFTWTVNDTTPPNFTIANQTNNEGDIVSIKTNPVDADAGSITATNLPTGLSIDSTTGVISGTIGAYAAGTYKVTLHATDGVVQNNTTFTWTVNDTSPPSFTIANQTNNEGDKVSVKTNPADADPGSIKATSLPTGLSIDPNTGLITGTIGAYAAGTYTVTVSATDGSLVGSTQFTWTVNDTSPPSFTIANQTNNEGDPVNVSTNPVDAKAGSITATGLPTGLSIDSTTGIITGTIDAHAAGIYQVTLTATDVAGNKGSTKFTWTVNDSTPPSFTVANQTNNEGDKVNVQTKPVDADVGSITATGLPTGLSIDPTSGVISGTIGAYAAGTYTVTVSATDGAVNGSTQFTWTVNDTTAPSFTIANQTNNEGDTVSVKTNPLDAAPGSITATGLPSGLSIDSTTGLITGTIGAYADGTYTVILNATDVAGNKGSAQFTWTVNDTNPPSFTIANQTNNEGDTVGISTNPMGADAGSITATGLPTGLSIDSTTGVITGTIGAYAAGTYTVTVSATDGTLVGSSKFTWTVNDSNAPSFTIANQTNNEGDKVSIKTNPVDAAPGSITATGLPTGLSIDSNTGLITGTIGAYAVGTYTVTLNATDVAGNKGSAQFTWIVNDTTPPSFTIANQTNDEGDTVSIKTSPVDADAASITATGLPTGLSIDPNTGVISGTIGAYAGGTYTVTVRATDGAVVGSSKFNWTVNDTSLPSFTIANQTNNEGDTVNVQTTPVDADAGSITATGLPAGLSINPTTGVISGTIGTFAAGTYQVVLQATDGSLVSTTPFTWTVNDTSPPALTNPGTQHSNPGASVNLVISGVDVDTSIFTATGLPPGLSISPNGVISGTISAPGGTYQVTVNAAFAGSSSSVSFAWVVNPMPTSIVITNIQRTYVGFTQVETVTAQVTDPAGFPINEGSVTFQVNGETLTAPVSNGIATATFTTPMLSLDIMILLNDFFTHGLDAMYSGAPGSFESSNTLTSDVAMLLDFLRYLETTFLAGQL